ncbi:hypothetical protein NKH18_35000 [Streptomyces sp. M10(2022)]
MQSNDARILRGAAIPTACAGLIGVLVGAVTVGSSGAIGAGIGTLLVLAFFGAGLYGMSVVGRRWPELFLGAGLLVYTTQILVLLLLLRVFRDMTFMDTRVFGITMLGCVLVWIAGQAWSNVRAKTPMSCPIPTSLRPDRSVAREFWMYPVPGRGRIKPRSEDCYRPTSRAHRVKHRVLCGTALRVHHLSADGPGVASAVPSSRDIQSSAATWSCATPTHRGSRSYASYRRSSR